MIPKARVLALLLAGAFVVVVAVPAGAKSDPKRDQEIAREALLDLGDFPTGWRDAGKQSSNPPAGSSCARIRSIEDASKKFKAESSEFESQTGLAENTVFVFPSAAKAKSYLEPYAATGRKCLIASAKREKSLKGAEVSVEEVDPTALIDATGSDDAVIFRTEVVQGTSTFVVIQAGVRVGRAVDGFTFLDTTGDVLPEAEGLVVVSLDRLGTALG